MADMACSLNKTTASLQEKVLASQPNVEDLLELQQRAHAPSRYVGIKVSELI